MHRLSQLSFAALAGAVMSTFAPAQSGWVAEEGGLKDLATGLVWSDAYCEGTFCFDRAQAFAFAAALAIEDGGVTYDDWRVPTLAEMEDACAHGAGVALEAHYQNPEFAGRTFWTSDMQARKWPIVANFVNCGSSAVGAGSTMYLVCVRGDVAEPPGGGKDKKKSTVGGGSGALEPYGTATVGCDGAPTLDANRDPVAGDPDFALCGHAAPPRARGMLLLGDVRAVLPHVVLGVELNVEPAGYFGVSDVQSLPDGSAEIPLPIPLTLHGCEVFAQLVWIDPTCPSAPLSGSRGLAMRVR